MKNTNLLISYAFLGILLVNISQAVPYRSPDLVEELKIPYCIDQVGYKCRVCGYNDELQKFTAPNALSTACLPTETGCKMFADLQGQVCSESDSTYCRCGFVQNHLHKCVPAPAGLENCLELNFAGDKCQTCPSPDANLGGHGDFGRSFDDTKCLDNVVNQVPNCGRYKNGDTECAQCRDGFLQNVAGKCVKTSLDPTSDDYQYCDEVNDAGVCIRCQLYAKFDSPVPPIVPKCIWGDNPDQSTNCLQFQKLPNGVQDNLAICIQCPVGYVIARDGCLQFGSTLGVNLGLHTTHANYRQWCLGVVGNSPNQICAIPLTKVEEYNQVTNPLPSTTTVSTAGNDDSGSCKTDKVNQVDLTCPSVDDCDNGTNAIVYQKNSKRCLKFSSVSSNLPLKYCKVADGKGWCETCHDGYVPTANGRCEAIKLAGCKTVNADGVSCDECFSNLITISTNGLSIQRYFYRLNLLDQTCTNPTDIDSLNCKTVDADGICTACIDNFALEEGVCKTQQKPDTQIANYGCQTFEGGQCTKPLNGFECDSLGIYCWVKDTSHNCQKFAADGTCEVCIEFDYVQAYDPATKKYNQCISTSGATSRCEKFSESCNTQCIECKPSYSKDTVNVSSYQCTRTGSNTPLTGCVQHTSDTACDTCAQGYIKTAANTCFSLNGRRFAAAGTGEGQIINASTAPEPCLVAANQYECTTCQASAGISTISIAGTFFTDTQARKFCIYNSQTSAQVKLNGSDVSLSAGTGCSEYEILAGPPIKIQCKTLETGATTQIGTWNGAKILYDKKTETGSHFTPGDFNCKAGKFDISISGCSECDTGAVLDTVSKKCITISQSNCRVGKITTGTTTQCTTCNPGYKLVINAADNIQCHSIQGVIALSGEAYCGISFNQVNADISASYGGTPASWTREVSSCGKGFQVKNKRCVAKLETILKCEEISSDTGNCKKCAAGYRPWVEGTSTFNDNPPRDKIFTTYCRPDVTNCQTYNPDFTKCTACKTDPVTMEQLFPDDSGSVCLKASVQRSTGCAQFALNNDKIEGCLKCKDPLGVLTDGCAQKDPFCTSWNTNGKIRYCTGCASTHKLNYQRKCVENILNLLADCDVAYNSTTCLNCDSTKVLVVNSDSQESDQIGICQAPQSHDDGCWIVNDQRDKCLRCKQDYGNLNGICIKNDAGLLSRCANYKYNTDSKRLYCSECDLGFAIDGNFTTCIANNNKCSDISGGNDCATVVELKPYGVVHECDSYRSASLLVAFGFILSFSLLLIL